MIQSTPVISRQLGAKIRERELSGSPVISRFRARAQTRDLQDQIPTLWRLHLLNPNSMMSDNGGTYISRISADVGIAPATNHNKPYCILIIMHKKTVKSHVAFGGIRWNLYWNHPNHDAVWQETEIASSLVAGFTETVWASWWKIHESRFKWRWFQHYWYDRNAKSDSIGRLYRPLKCICTEKICRESRHSQNRTKCVKYVWLSYPTWPSRWVFCISMQWLRLKGCHVACDEWTSGEICSLQHMWVIGSVMWVAARGESLNFGVQGATATNWFPRVNGARDNGIWLYN